MRRKLITLLTGVAMLVAVSPGLAQEHGEEVTGRDYGTHVASHAQDGLLGQEHNPGHHQGFAGFVEHHHHDE